MPRRNNPMVWIASYKILFDRATSIREDCNGTNSMRNEVLRENINQVILQELASALIRGSR